MADERPPLILKEDSHRGESRALNISLRGWIALIVILTFCVCALRSDDPVAAMKDVVYIVITCYFATKPNNPNPPKP